MEEYQLKIKQIEIITAGIMLRLFSLAPFCGCFFNWTTEGNSMIDFANSITTYIGIFIIFVSIFLRCRNKLKIRINILGYIMIWVPILLRFFLKIVLKNINYTVDFYTSMLLVCICIFLETLLMSKYPVKE